MRTVVTPVEMAALDRYTIHELGVPAVALMERAALAVADEVERIAPSGIVAIACGPGNNGGDGLAAARILRLRGRDVRCFAPVQEYKDQAAATHLDAARRCCVPITEELDDFRRALNGAAVVVDALFGNGLDRALEGRWRETVTLINTCGAPVLSVDMPSGIDGATGHVLGEAVRAAVTVTFQWAKVGHLLFPGRDYASRLVVADIGIADRAAVTPGEPPLHRPRRVLEAADCALPPRRADTFKNSYGHVVVVAGSLGMEGAGALCARAALRTGAGLVSWLLPRAADASLRPPEAMAVPLPDVDGGLSEAAAEPLLAALKGKTVAALGPGLGRRDATVALIRHILSVIDIPMILDADACFAICGYPQLIAGKDCVLTPHPGEMARLMDVDTAEVVADPLGMAQRCARMYGAVVVLKGATSVVAGPDGAVTFNLTGNPGMATAGSGDALAGIIAGLAAQGQQLYEAAAKGCWIHGRAGDLASERLGQASMLSGDIIDSLPEVLRRGGEQ